MSNRPDNDVDDNGDLYDHLMSDLLALEIAWAREQQDELKLAERYDAARDSVGAARCRVEAATHGWHRRALWRVILAGFERARQEAEAAAEADLKFAAAE